MGVTILGETGLVASSIYSTDTTVDSMDPIVFSILLCITDVVFEWLWIYIRMIHQPHHQVGSNLYQIKSNRIDYFSSKLTGVDPCFVAIAIPWAKDGGEIMA